MTSCLAIDMTSCLEIEIKLIFIINCIIFSSIILEIQISSSGHPIFTLKANCKHCITQEKFQISHVHTREQKKCFSIKQILNFHHQLLAMFSIRSFNYLTYVDMNKMKIKSLYIFFLRSRTGSLNVVCQLVSHLCSIVENDARTPQMTQMTQMTRMAG